jgi:hypothetical protein
LLAGPHAARVQHHDALPLLPSLPQTATAARRCTWPPRGGTPRCSARWPPPRAGRSAPRPTCAASRCCTTRWRAAAPRWCSSCWPRACSRPSPSRASGPPPRQRPPAAPAATSPAAAAAAAAARAPPAARRRRPATPSHSSPAR